MHSKSVPRRGDETGAQNGRLRSKWLHYRYAMEPSWMVWFVGIESAFICVHTWLKKLGSENLSRVDQFKEGGEVLITESGGFGGGETFTHEGQELQVTDPGHALG